MYRSYPWTHKIVVFALAYIKRLVEFMWFFSRLYAQVSSQVFFVPINDTFNKSYVEVL